MQLAYSHTLTKSEWMPLCPKQSLENGVYNKVLVATQIQLNLVMALEAIGVKCRDYYDLPITFFEIKEVYFIEAQSFSIGRRIENES